MISRVTYRFLDGNLTDGLAEPVTEEQESEIGTTYAIEVERALQREFPNAEINVEHERHTSGSVPLGSIDVESDSEDIYLGHREAESAEFVVQRISEEIWERCEEWWPSEPTYEAYRYAADGHGGERVPGGVSDGQVIATGTLDECREAIARRIDGTPANLRWDGLDGDIEAYHEGDTEGCGGYAIREVRS